MADHTQINHYLNELLSKGKHIGIGPSVTGGNLDTVVCNIDFAAIGAEKKNLGKRFSSHCRSARERYGQSQANLPKDLTESLGRVGFDLTIALGDAAKAIDHYDIDEPPNYNPSLVATTFSQGMLAAKMLEGVKAIYEHENKNGNAVAIPDRIKRFGAALRRFDASLKHHAQEAERIADYFNYRDRLTQEETVAVPGIVPYRGTPQPFLPAVPEGAPLAAPVRLVNANATSSWVGGIYGAPTKEHSWAAPALSKLQCELAAIKHSAPQLLAAMEADRCEIVITNGSTLLYEKGQGFQVEGVDQPEAAMGRNQYIATRRPMEDGLKIMSAVIFPAARYPNVPPVCKLQDSIFMSEANTAAHEIAHMGDRFIPDPSKITRVAEIDTGYHSQSNLFRICTKLDAIFDPHGICNYVDKVVGSIREYGPGEDTFLQELLPRAVENYIGNPQSREHSPIITSYIENIFLHDMQIKGAGKSGTEARAALKKDMGTSYKVILGDATPAFENYAKCWNKMRYAAVHFGDWSNQYQAARDGYREAKAELVAHKDEIQERIIAFMESLKERHPAPPPASVSDAEHRGIIRPPLRRGQSQ